MGFTLENIIDDQSDYSAPGHTFLSTVSRMVQSFPWERFERYFEARPLIEASAVDQVFILRVLAIQEVLCVDDEGILHWLKNQMYLSAFLSPGFKPKVPTKELLCDFRGKLDEENLLESFRLRCQYIILQESPKPVTAEERTNYVKESTPTTMDFSEITHSHDRFRSTDETLSEVEIKDEWVACPHCDSTELNQVASGLGSKLPHACCNRCGHHFKA